MADDGIDDADGFPYRLLLLMLVVFLLASNVLYTSHYLMAGNNAYAHLTEIPGAQSNVMSKATGSYVVLFQSSPSPVELSGNSTLLRFSIMQNNQDTYNVYAALIVKENKFYEFGDIDFRHTFQNPVDHQVILQARIAGDQQYQNNPLVASFDIRVINLEIVKFVQIMVILTLAALSVGIVILFLHFNRTMKRESASK
jgi:hypothetical protein